MRHECERRIARPLRLCGNGSRVKGSSPDTYEDTFLFDTLATTLLPEIERCCIVLQDMLEMSILCRDGLAPTPIRALWRHVWWNTVDEETWRKEIRAHHTSHITFLWVLNSYVHVNYHVLMSANFLATKRCMDRLWKSDL
jgi:hypothetical protein